VKFAKGQIPLRQTCFTITAIATTRECLPSETWLAMPIFKDATCVPIVLVWYTIIWNLQ